MNNKILITTPDYPPQKIGGISTFVLNLESALKENDFEYDLFVWDSYNKIKTIDLSHYQIILNAHFLFSFHHRNPRMINFIHSAEIIPYSRNILKYLYKKVFYRRVLSSIEQSYKNIFISQFAQNLFSSLGGKLNYSRDLVFHNCINLGDSSFIQKDLNEPLIFCCFVRDVPHKNIKGTISFFEKIKSLHSHGARLYITTECNSPDIINISNATDVERELIYQKAHFNLLLSLDHRKKGNVEGFGLTVLEAGKYGVPSIVMNTGGLPESVHDNFTGWVLESGNFSKEQYDSLILNYQKISNNVYEHTRKSHSIKELSVLLRYLCE